MEKLSDFLKLMIFSFFIFFIMFVVMNFFIFGKDDMFRWIKRSIGWSKSEFVRISETQEIAIPPEYQEIKDVRKLYEQALALDIDSYYKKNIVKAIKSEMESMEYRLVRKIGEDLYLIIKEKDSLKE